MSDVPGDPRGFLAAIVGSGDSSITVRERLDALKLLEDLGGLPHPACKCFGPEVDEASVELDSHTDALLRDIILGLQGKYPFEEWEPFGDPAQRFPHTVAAIGTYVEREARSSCGGATNEIGWPSPRLKSVIKSGGFPRQTGPDDDDRADRTAADLRRYERRMRAQLANVVTVQTASLGQHSLARLAHR